MPLLILILSASAAVIAAKKIDKLMLQTERKRERAKTVKLLREIYIYGEEVERLVKSNV